jgi:hypothetical protein
MRLPDDRKVMIPAPSRRARSGTLRIDPATGSDVRIGAGSRGAL